MGKYPSNRTQTYVWLFVCDVIAALCFSSYILYMTAEHGHNLGAVGSIVFAFALYACFAIGHGIISYRLTKTIVFPTVILMSGLLLSLLELFLIERFHWFDICTDVALEGREYVQMMSMVVLAAHILSSLVTKLFGLKKEK